MKTTVLVSVTVKYAIDYWGTVTMVNTFHILQRLSCINYYRSVLLLSADLFLIGRVEWIVLLESCIITGEAYALTLVLSSTNFILIPLITPHTIFIEHLPFYFGKTKCFI